MNLFRSAVIATALLLLAGCATSRGTMALSVPAASGAIEGDRVAVIGPVVDQRVFEVDPRQPSTPSLKKGDAYTLDAQQRKQAIARKRNGYGKALGDILLEGDQTVETVTADLIRAALQQRGFRVVSAADAGPDALHVAATIDKFWAWFSPGFWSVSMEAQVYTTISMRDATGTRQARVEAYGINKGQSGREDNWRVAYERAFAEYSSRMQGVLINAGF